MSAEKGIVFDIKEFALHDGPGIRTTVFIKGCPLACCWCHNPEGLSSVPQVMRSAGGGRTVGRWYDVDELAAILNQQADFLAENGGGVTFSGGEPLMQADFVSAVIDKLNNIHVVLDTSGYGEESDFCSLAKKVDLLFYDLKIVDPADHIRFTGRDNSIILRNFKLLNDFSTPVVVRVPLVPGITDSRFNLASIAEIVRNARNLIEVDLLEYNPAARGKYQGLGMAFNFSNIASRPVEFHTDLFEQAGIKVKCMRNHYSQEKGVHYESCDKI